MKPVIVHVDAFTDKPFTGNPAVVCLWPAWTTDPQAGSSRDYRFSEEMMQNVAREMNVPETAFIERIIDGFGLRWFTPVCEVDLCGHATLAGAHVLWERSYLKKNEEARFHTRSGLIVARQADHGIDMEFPAEPEQPATPPFDLGQAIGARMVYVGKNRFDYLVEVESETVLRGLRPNLDILRNMEARGFIFTSRSENDRYDFVSRFFAPAVGIDEDPVTGSAHCCLGPYWGKKLDKQELFAYQASERGGEVRVRLDGPKVWLGGQAVTVTHGELV